MQTNRILSQARIRNRMQAQHISHVRNPIQPERQIRCLDQRAGAWVRGGREAPLADGALQDFHQAVGVGVVVDRAGAPGGPD
jgi:hypothetical protein